MAGKKALLVIDVQKGIVRGLPVHDAEGVLKRIRSLQDHARNQGIPVVHVQHDGPKGHKVEEGTSSWHIDPVVAPSGEEPVIHKRASDSFFETTLDEELQRLGVTQLVIAGCMTPYCVDTTCRRAISLGYDVTLVGDAHITSSESGLTAKQIITHHNNVLDGFAAGNHKISVQPASEIDLSSD